MYYVYTTGLFYIPHHWNPAEIATGTLLEGKRREGEFPPTPGKDKGEKNSRVRTELFISAMYHYYSIKHTHP